MLGVWPVAATSTKAADDRPIPSCASAAASTSVNAASTTSATAASTSRSPDRLSAVHAEQSGRQRHL